MSQDVEGYVEEISVSHSKEGASRSWTRMGFKVDGKQYSAFKNQENADALAAVGRGDKVKVRFTSNTKDGKTYNNIDKIKVLEKGKPEDKVSVGDRDVRVNFGFARDSAITLVLGALAYDAKQSDLKDRIVTLPAKKDRLDAVVALIEELAVRFAESSWNASTNMEEETGEEENTEQEAEKEAEEDDEF
ncbi:hypothetical protein LCGC14_2720190 [marine sediment metagenome]|uniref:Uncharacterized protein n=1 Tax=marine sediment metagenome TaxID=412755 RepID=A0A0F8ZAD7_9ZZZZ